MPDIAIELPDNPVLIELTAQDVITFIADQAEEQEEADGLEVLQYLRGASPEELYAIGLAVRRNITNPRHLVEAIIEEVQQTTFQDLLQAAQGTRKMPEPTREDLREINLRRLECPSPGITLSQALLIRRDGDDLREKLMDTPVDRQQALDQVIANVIRSCQDRITQCDLQVLGELGEAIRGFLAETP